MGRPHPLGSDLGHPPVVNPTLAAECASREGFPHLLFGPRKTNSIAGWATRPTSLNLDLAKYSPWSVLVVEGAGILT